MYAKDLFIFEYEHPSASINAGDLIAQASGGAAIRKHAVHIKYIKLSL